MTTDSDISAAAGIAKRTAALLRDARSVQRRLDTLAATALSVEDPSLPLIAEARTAVQRLVVELTYRERGEQRRARAGHRIRGAGLERPAQRAPAALSPMPGYPPARGGGRLPTAWRPTCPPPGSASGCVP
ncbi:MAG: hypothetical protein M0027_13950 [Candidatus Dormibacteraeota bacterium]|nr:hypothetical protein [Candidatus Dormibacteraeota bacterium]